eukprot:3835555-Amphidinium_carterae.1
MKLRDGKFPSKELRKVLIANSVQSIFGNLPVNPCPSTNVVRCEDKRFSDLGTEPIIFMPLNDAPRNCTAPGKASATPYRAILRCRIPPSQSYLYAVLSGLLASIDGHSPIYFFR